MRPPGGVGDARCMTTAVAIAVVLLALSATNVWVHLGPSRVHVVTGPLAALLLLLVARIARLTWPELRARAAVVTARCASSVCWPPWSSASCAPWAWRSPSPAARSATRNTCRWALRRCCWWGLDGPTREPAGCEGGACASTAVSVVFGLTMAAEVCHAGQLWLRLPSHSPWLLLSASLSRRSSTSLPAARRVHHRAGRVHHPGRCRLFLGG